MCKVEWREPCGTDQDDDDHDLTMQPTRYTTYLMDDGGEEHVCIAEHQSGSK